MRMGLIMEQGTGNREQEVRGDRPFDCGSAALRMSGRLRLIDVGRLYVVGD